MQSNYRLLSSILRGQWLIDRSFAVSQLPLVYSLLSGNNVASEAGKENEEVSHAKVYAIGTVAAEN
ncbi:MAG: hypothetical protein ACO1OQ_12800, partial [Rufibacter sp.]